MLLDYNPEWKNQFKEFKELLTEQLSISIIGVEHVESTSISGMKAKPIIDLDIIIIIIIIENNNDVLKKIIDGLKTLSYIHLGEMGISGREAFKRINSNTPITD